MSSDAVEVELPPKTRKALEIVEEVFGPDLAKAYKHVAPTWCHVAPRQQSVASEYSPFERM